MEPVRVGKGHSQADEEAVKAAEWDVVAVVVAVVAEAVSARPAGRVWSEDEITQGVITCN